jgi:hypothetical protein
MGTGYTIFITIFDGLDKSKISPSGLGVTGGDVPCTVWYRVKARGINNLAKFPDSSPSPQPSPVKGEEVFSTFHFGDNCI